MKTACLRLSDVFIFKHHVLHINSRTCVRMANSKGSNHAVWKAFDWSKTSSKPYNSRRPKVTQSTSHIKMAAAHTQFGEMVQYLILSTIVCTEEIMNRSSLKYILFWKMEIFICGYAFEVIFSNLVINIWFHLNKITWHYKYLIRKPKPKIMNNERFKLPKEIF